MTPFIYYVLNKKDIETYLTIELDGSMPYMINRELLISHILRFVDTHKNGIDESHIKEYVDYICNRVSSRNV